jgi:hypothetical protein
MSDEDAAERGTRVMENNPELFVAVAIVLMQRLGQLKARITAQEMAEAPHFGLRFKSDGSGYVDIELCANPHDTMDRSKMN